MAIALFSADCRCAIDMQLCVMNFLPVKDFSLHASFGSNNRLVIAKFHRSTKPIGF